MLLLLIFMLLASSYAKSEIRLTSLHFPIVAQNRILAVNTTCNATNFNVTLLMEKPFKGLLSTKEFAKECRTIGHLKNTVSLTVPTSGCGVRMNANSSDGSMYYTLIVVAQQDQFLRLITDQEKTVRCRLRDGALSLNSAPMFEALKTEVEDEKESRTGRMRNGWNQNLSNHNETTNLLDKELGHILSAARAWMEISPIENHTIERVQVGEPTLLSVKSTLPAGIGWRVVDCTAHDGIGEISQRLLDEIGCPIDDTILPALTKTEPKMMGKNGDKFTMMRHQEAVASFPAFKFPDRDRLHVSCGLQLCRGKCEAINCGQINETHRDSRISTKGDRGEILDRLEVFNSVEVTAPGIELEDLRNPEVVAGEKYTPNLHIPGDRPFCVSPNKMAIAFCILGIIFVVAVMVALCSLMRARRTGARMPYYSRSLFSSSSGESEYRGSKLLLHESPTMGQTRHWRIL